MWTKVVFESFVEDGYADSGWELSTLWIASRVERSQLKTPMSQHMRQTAISKSKFRSMEYVEPFTPEFYHVVIDEQGNWAGT